MATDSLHDAHVLIPDALAAELPCLYATQHEDDAIARIKLFTPDSGWTWLVLYAELGIRSLSTIPTTGSASVS